MPSRQQQPTPIDSARRFLDGILRSDKEVTNTVQPDDNLR